MAKTTPPQPTPAELRILQALWDLGPSTVRDILEVIDNKRKTGYTTVLKFLQIMTEKGLVVRDDSQRSHVYRARYTEKRTQKALLGDVMDRAFRGSASRLVMQALSGKRVPAEELEAIRALLDEAEGRSKKGPK